MKRCLWKTAFLSELGGVNSLVCAETGQAAEDEEKNRLVPSLTDVGKLVLKAEPADRKREEDSLHAQKGATMVRLDDRRRGDGFQPWRR